MSNKKNKGNKQDPEKSSLIPYDRTVDKVTKNDMEYLKSGIFYDQSQKLLEKRKLIYDTWEESYAAPFSGVPRKVFDVIQKVIKQHSVDLFGGYTGIKAKEEDISVALADRITDSLLGELKHQLDDRIIGEYKFRIVTQKKQQQESKTGADLFGVCTVDHGLNPINKYFLIQAKVATRREDGSVYAKDERIFEQAVYMTQISPASFFVLYTDSGFEVVSALNVVSLGESKIDTAHIHSRPYEEFNNMILECFIGDNRCELEPWKNYINNPKKHPIPKTESLLHMKVEKIKPLPIRKKPKSVLPDSKL